MKRIAFLLLLTLGCSDGDDSTKDGATAGSSHMGGSVSTTGGSGVSSGGIGGGTGGTARSDSGTPYNNTGGSQAGSSAPPPPVSCTADTDCDDNNPCTDDSCGADSKCTYNPNHDGCDDDDACTTDDTCSDGQCLGQAIVCDANADDPCVQDSCDPETGCVTTETTETCDDDNACTIDDVCSNGTCTGTAKCSGLCIGGICQDQESMITPVAAGGDNTCARLENGDIRCWGSNVAGKLGNAGATGDVGDDETPASVDPVDIGGPVTNISIGSGHLCAVLTEGTVRCWGGGGYGRLGYAHNEAIGDDETPASVGDVDVGGEVIQVAAGVEHTCALLVNGKVRCWGDGGMGKLGYGDRIDEDENIGDDETPASAGDVNVGGTVVQIDVGQYDTIALLADGAVRVWGGCGYGICGIPEDIGNIGDNEAPSEEPTIDLGGSAIQVSAGRLHNCALMEGGTVRCWGYGGHGQLGYGETENIGDDEIPAEAGDVDVGGTVTQISVGDEHTCALLSDGAVRCWGDGEDGKLGYGNTEDIGDDETPDDAGDVDLGGTAKYISAGRSHTCAVMSDNAIRCWGLQDWGRLGYGNMENPTALGDCIGDDETPASAGDVEVF